MRTFLFIIFVYQISAFFWNIPFGKKFSIKEKEKNVKIKYKLPYFKQRIVNKINGFYGIIGPDINMTSVRNLFDLFVGDGNIQGIFLKNGELTYVKHFIRTEKILYEENNGRIPNNGMIKAVFFLFSNFNVLPNILGLANTAIFNVYNNSYALYERDKPYLIDIDFNKTRIQTIKKMNDVPIDHFSAHSKFGIINDTIESIDYQMMTQTVSYHQLDKDFKSINKVNIKTNYLPIIHDFSSSNNKTIITDAPLLYNGENFLKKKFPVKLDKSKNTIVHVLNHKNFTVESFKTNESFYLFHYADCKENDNYIEIYASLYDYLDFSQLNITGKYRKIVIDKKRNTTFIERNRELEKLDLDFPLKFDKNKIVLRNLDKNIIDGFVVCENLKIIKRIHLKERFFCGEPAIFYIEKKPYLITFAFNYNNIEENFLILINMRNYKIIEIPIREKLSIGFHSIYLSNNK